MPSKARQKTVWRRLSTTELRLVCVPISGLRARQGDASQQEYNGPLCLRAWIVDLSNFH